jgi:hypothetical protein
MATITEKRIKKGGATMEIIKGRIKRSLIVLAILTSIVFAPYLIGSWFNQPHILLQWGAGFLFLFGWTLLLFGAWQLVTGVYEYIKGDE